MAGLLGRKEPRHILLDETAEATHLLDDLPKEEKDEFMSFPIYNFYKKSVEETQNGQA